MQNVFRETCVVYWVYCKVDTSSFSLLVEHNLDPTHEHLNWTILKNEKTYSMGVLIRYEMCRDQKTLQFLEFCVYFIYT